ncbi:MAG: histidinol-phosphate transaminase [Candidatus Caenarcaniphilales bacterium]|nr:histidinol-phosphate transaminase [Candidatus Caenarcaniphilales bacterium]
MNPKTSKQYKLKPCLDSKASYKAGATFEELIAKYGFKREEILRLAGNESTIGASPKAIDAAQRAASSSNFYDEPQSSELINALEKSFAEDISMQELGIVVGNGMDRIIEQILNLFCEKGDSIVNFSPSFDFYSFAALREGLKILDLGRDTENFYPNLEGLKEKIYQHQEETSSQVKIIFICSPNNPTGTLVQREDLEELAKFCEQENIVLFIDHAYIEFTDRKTNDFRELISEYPNTVIGYTFSKVYGLAGYRVGYALLHKELQELYLKYNTPFLCAKPSLKAAKAALEDKEHLQKIIDNNNQEKPYLVDSLTKLGYFCYPSHANFLLFQIPESKKLNADDLLEILKSKGIILRKAHSVSEKSIRVTIGQRHENLRLIEALTSID